MQMFKSHPMPGDFVFVVCNPSRHANEVDGFCLGNSKAKSKNVRKKYHVSCTVSY